MNLNTYMHEPRRVVAKCAWIYAPTLQVYPPIDGTRYYDIS